MSHAVIIIFMQCCHKTSDTAKITSPHQKLVKEKKKPWDNKTTIPGRFDDQRWVVSLGGLVGVNIYVSFVSVFHCTQKNHED